MTTDPGSARSFLRPSAFRLGLVVSAGVLAFAHAAAAEQVRVVLLSPPEQMVLPGDVVPMPFRFRVERATGEPVPAAQVWYIADFILCSNAGCPDRDERGAFEPGLPNGPNDVLVTTGDDGTATTPAFYAGRPHVGRQSPFPVYFLALITPQTTPEGIVIDGIEGDPARSTVWIQGPGAIPTLGAATSATLIALLAASGLWTIRAHRRRNAS